MSEVRVPPNDIAAEAVTLGSMILKSSIVPEIKGVVSADDFYRPAHQSIFDAICKMMDRREPVDLVTLPNALKLAGSLELIGGIDYLSDLVESTPDSTNAEYYAKIVKDKSVKRQMIVAAGELSQKAYDDSDDAEAINSLAQQRLFDIANRGRRQGGSEADIHSAARAALDLAQKIQDNPNKFGGIPTGFFKLDNAIGKLRRGHLITVAGKTGAGKSVLALNIAVNAADKGARVLYISAEMTPVELAQRAMQARAGISGSRLQNGSLQVKHWERLYSAEEGLADLKLQIIGRSLTIAEIGLKARELAIKWGGPIDLIVIDYIQIMTMQGKDLRTSLTEFTRGLKMLAMELNTTIIGVSQIVRPRSVPNRTQQLPTMFDLKESGSIENDSNAVLLLHRPEPVNKYRDANDRSFIEVWLRAEKVRDGTTTPWPADGEDASSPSIRLAWYPSLTLFLPFPYLANQNELDLPI